MLINSKNRFYNQDAIRWIRESDNSIQNITFNELMDSVKVIFYALTELGFQKEDHIAICSHQVPEWIMADLGIQTLGAATIAIYPHLKSEEIKFILKDSKSKAIFIDNDETMEKISSIINELPDLKCIIIFESNMPRSAKSFNIKTFEELISLGIDQYHSSNRFNFSVSKIKEEDIASIIYPPDNTGDLKGVMLSHRNLLSDAFSSVSVISTLKKRIKPEEHHYLSLLPFSHSFGKIIVIASLLTGATIDMISTISLLSIQTSLEKFQPTIMLGLPFIFQKIYEYILKGVPPNSGEKNNPIYDIMENGKKYYKNKVNGKRNKINTLLKQKIGGKKIKKSIKEKLGGNLLLLIDISGNTPKNLIYFYNTIGIPLIQGYGLPEASAITHLSRSKKNAKFRPDFKKKRKFYEKIGSIGPPIEIPDNPYDNIHQKIYTENGELLIKGPMVMKGYWNRPDETSKIIDDHEWLHTGDLGEIDEDGYLFIKKKKGKMVPDFLPGKWLFQK
jgi:long-chain acyl-CoA synthetase